ATRVESRPPPVGPPADEPGARPKPPRLRSGEEPPRLRSGENEAPPSAERRTPGPLSAGSARSARAVPLDEAKLDELAARIASLPEPVAGLAVGVEVARAEGDATGVRKRLFELGIGVVRYGAAVGLAVLAARLGSATAPKPIADALGRAARL